MLRIFPTSHISILVYHETLTTVHEVQHNAIYLFPGQTHCSMWLMKVNTTSVQWCQGLSKRRVIYSQSFFWLENSVQISQAKKISALMPRVRAMHPPLDLASG